MMVAATSPALGPRRELLAHAVLALGGFAFGTTEFASMGFLPAFSADFAATAPDGAKAISAYALGVVCGAPVLAVLGAAVARRRLLIGLLAWFAICNVASAMTMSLGGLIALRFLAGLPHGAYFGAAVLLAVETAAADRRGAAIGRVLLGLTLATTVGAPLAQYLSQGWGWRHGFQLLGLLAGVAAVAIVALVPYRPASGSLSLARELGALRRPQVWLSLATGAVGFGGMFAVYTYLGSTLEAVTHASHAAVPAILCVFGLGLTAGNLLAPRLAGRGVLFAAGCFLAWSTFALAVYPMTVHHLAAMAVSVFLIGLGGGLGTVLQMRLMDVAGDAQNLAASLNHAAFNVANALGPWLAGLAISAGLGWQSTGWVGSGLALGGLAICLLAGSAAAARSAVDVPAAPT